MIMGLTFQVSFGQSCRRVHESKWNSSSIGAIGGLNQSSLRKLLA